MASGSTPPCPTKKDPVMKLKRKNVPVKDGPKTKEDS